MRQKKFIAVVASSKPEVPKINLEMASYACKNCGNSFAVNASIDPFCVHCGSTEVDELDDALLEDENVTTLPEDEEELSTVVCPECGQHNIMSDATAVALAGLMSCVTCGSEIAYEYSEISAELEEEEPLGDDADIEEDIEEDLDDAEESAMKPGVRGGGSYPKGKKGKGPTPTKNSKFMSPQTKEVSGDSLEEEDLDVGLEDDIEDSAEESGTDKKGKVTCGLVDVVIASTNAPLTFERLNPFTILAFIGDVCVARLNNSDDYEHRDVFTHPSFIRSLENSVTANGTAATLKDFDFSIPQVHVDEETVQAMASMDTTMALAQAKAFNDVNEIVRQCISIAAVGLNKGFWKEKPHVLKAHLYEEMRAAGVRNPSAMIDRVFAKFSDDHHRTLFEIAFDLMGKTPDVRNSLAEAVGDVNYLKVEQPQDVDLEDGQRLEDSLIKASTSTHVLDIPKGRLFAVNG